MNVQRTILWIIFGMSLLFLYDNWQREHGRPSMFGGPPPQTTPAKGAAQAPAESPATPAAKDSSIPPSTPAQPGGESVATPPAAAPVAAAAQRVRIETDMVRADIDPNGAVLVHLELRKQKVAPDWTAAGLMSLITGKKQDREANVVLLDVSNQRVYTVQTGLIGAQGASYPNHRTLFTPIDGPRTLEAGQDSLTVKFVAESGGLKLIKSYTFKRGRYDIEVKHEVINDSGAAVAPSLYLQILRDGNKPEGESGMYHTFTGPAVYTDAEKFHKIEFSDIEKNKLNFPRSAKDGWVAMIQHYFVTAWVPPEGAPRELYAREVDKNLFSVGSILPLASIAPGASATSPSTLYVGPEDQNALKEIAPGLDLVVDYGWLTFIAKPLYWLLEFFHRLLGNWGWAIIMLTVVVKAAFYPLSAASYKSMAKMKEVTPRLMKLREQYADDKQKLNTAMMEMYKTEKINPLGGCLPILVQIPVFIALYWVLLASVEMRNSPWILWVKDLATPDPWFILPLVMMASMWIQYKLNPTPPDPVQAKVMAVMPFIFGAMFFMFPAGLVLYWVVNNVLSILQQWYVTRQIAAAKRVG
ncbi:MAG: membrane protein insertase YidC [Gemmatimonadota bacterium]